MRTIKEILSRHKDKLEYIFTQFSAYISKGEVKKGGSFENYKEISLSECNYKIYIGVKTSFDIKKDLVRKILDVVEDDLDVIEWYDINEIRQL